MSDAEKALVTGPAAVEHGAGKILSQELPELVPYNAITSRKLDDTESSGKAKDANSTEHAEDPVEKESSGSASGYFVSEEHDYHAA